MAVDMVPTSINGRWELLLPRHRAERESWPWWEAERLAAMRTVIGLGSVVWDVGAEEGDFPALWASWGAHVMMAEPNPKVWPNIRAVFEANDLGGQVNGCWVGFLGDTEHEAGPDWPRPYAGFGGVHQAVDGVDGRRRWEPWWPACATGEVIGDHGFLQLGERPDCPMTTVDAIRSKHGPPPTVVTMDVEGAELHVLRGALVTLAEYRPDVFVSIHPEFMLHHYGVPDGVEVVCSLMAEVGYEAEFLAFDHEHHYWFRP